MGRRKNSVLPIVSPNIPYEDKENTTSSIFERGKSGKPAFLRGGNGRENGQTSEKIYPNKRPNAMGKDRQKGCSPRNISRKPAVFIAK